MFMLLSLSVIVSTVLNTEAGEVSFQTIGRKLLESGYRGRYDNGLRDDDVTDYVNAAEVWDDDEMLKLLGLDEEEVMELDEKGTEHLDTAAVPTLLSTLYQELHDPESRLNPVKCRYPGMKGNVVRMLNSKGRILSQTQRTTIVDLQFLMKNVMQSYENITDAKLKISAPALTQVGEKVWDHMAGKTAGKSYKYEIYFINESNMEKLRNRLSHMKTSKQDTDLLGMLGRPLIVEHFTKILTAKKLEINIKPLVEKWRKKHFEKKKRAISRGILVITMETDVGSITKQCFRAIISTPRLLLVSQDTRQCPLSVTSYDDVSGDLTKDGSHERQKREIRSEKKERKRRKGRKRNKNDTESVLGVPVPRFKKRIETPEGNPDLDLRKNTGQSRSIRSTICRRYPMYIRFDEVGWGRWIIAPRGYQAYRCAGECPFPLGGKLNGTNHAVLMTMMHSVEPWSTPQPCCVPTVLAPISLLYFDTTGNVVLRQYEDMVVSNCGCR